MQDVVLVQVPHGCRDLVGRGEDGRRVGQPPVGGRGLRAEPLPVYAVLPTKKGKVLGFWGLGFRILGVSIHFLSHANVWQLLGAAVAAGIGVVSFESCCI